MNKNSIISSKTFGFNYNGQEIGLRWYLPALGLNDCEEAIKNAIAKDCMSLAIRSDDCRLESNANGLFVTTRLPNTPETKNQVFALGFKRSNSTF